MEALRLGLMVIAATLAAPAGAADYYYGRVSFFSPDGKTPYGGTDSAVKREILDGGARIIETVTQPGSSHSQRPKEIVTELKRRQKTLIYDASDAGRTFTGIVAFKAPELKAWTYDIKLRAGGTIKGSGSLSPEGIKTKKRFLGGGRPMSLKEDLKSVSESEYKTRVTEMRPPVGAE